jgi:Lar family restriction alleviation protein
MSEHKLCPFCGSAEQGAYMRFLPPPGGVGWVVVCKCGARSAVKPTKAEAWEAWDRRA